jgi:hypothetical protein
MTITVNSIIIGHHIYLLLSLPCRARLLTVSLSPNDFLEIQNPSCKDVNTEASPTLVKLHLQRTKQNVIWGLQRKKQNVICVYIYMHARNIIVMLDMLPIAVQLLYLAFLSKITDADFVNLR